VEFIKIDWEKKRWMKKGVDEEREEWESAIKKGSK